MCAKSAGISIKSQKSRHQQQNSSSIKKKQKRWNCPKTWRKYWLIVINVKYNIKIFGGVCNFCVDSLISIKNCGNNNKICKVKWLKEGGAATKVNN